MNQESIEQKENDDANDANDDDEEELIDESKYSSNVLELIRFGISIEKAQETLEKFK